MKNGSLNESFRDLPCFYPILQMDSTKIYPYKASLLDSRSSFSQIDDSAEILALC